VLERGDFDTQEATLHSEGKVIALIHDRRGIGPSNGMFPVSPGRTRPLGVVHGKV